MQLQTHIQKPTAASWTDEQGIPIPFNRLSPHEKHREKIVGRILADALKINKQLSGFKTAALESIAALRKELLNDKKAPKVTKGNITFYNFDRSIKVEINVNETIQFDESLIAAAREKLDSFISKNVAGTDEVVRTLINSAFHNTKGGLDSKKVLSLVKYRTKIKAADFQTALDLIEQSISRPSSRQYMRVWGRDEKGAYQNIDLNFSSI